MFVKSSLVLTSDNCSNNDFIYSGFSGLLAAPLIRLFMSSILALTSMFEIVFIISSVI